jgi:starch phosphorylase
MKENTKPTDFNPASCDFHWGGGMYEDDSVLGLKKDIIRHIVSSLGSDYERFSSFNYYLGLALAVRDRLIDLWIKTQRSYYNESAKRVYYMSLEYLPGKSLLNNLHCLGLYDTAIEALKEFGYSLDDLAEVEWDAGLGNGGLGRLASCYLDSIATLNLSGYGYGIRYDYGIFHQVIENGVQIEKCDNWMRVGNPWEFQRGRFMADVQFYGYVNQYTDSEGRLRTEWKDGNRVLAMPCDMLIPGYGNNSVINMRLWSARSDTEFRLDFFNTGNYVGAVEEKVKDENISKVLYPSEQSQENRELRLKQQYFFVTATLQDILRRYKKANKTFDVFPDRVAIQLNDTHPSIAIPELMRMLVDEECVDWDQAWGVCKKTFAYTNHTILPEALETWPCEMLGHVLPRHLQIIYEINKRFLDRVQEVYPDDVGRLSRMSLIQEKPRAVRMANLSIVGSRSVNGVSALHTEILKHRVFRDFHEMEPTLFNNKTNGITPRRWLLQCNHAMAQLISQRIGSGWVSNLDMLKDLEPHAEDPDFRRQWREIRRKNKERLATYVKRKINVDLDLDSLFDVHVKRMHEYKRQLLNVLHVITLYNRMKDSPMDGFTPRTVFFGGKAAPSYFMAKLIIRLINAVAWVVNTDPDIKHRLKVVFLPNYCVSQAERIIPATDLSEQISTAGMEASGTGNMKFALNGSLIIGTLDGANIEIRDEVGPKNMFVFGASAEELEELRMRGYNPWNYYNTDMELKRALDMILNNSFSSEEPGLYKPIFDSLLYGDRFFVLADYRAYIQCQEEVSAVYKDVEDWTRRSILNTARMGKFSSDRAIAEYASEIWRVEPILGGESGA